MRKACASGWVFIALTTLEMAPRAAAETVSYSLPAAQLSLQEPVILNFAVRNNYREPIKLDLGQDRKGSFLFTVTRPDSERISLPQFAREGISRIGMLTIEPAHVYTQRLLLNEWFDFYLPGKYTIEVRLASPVQRLDGTAIAETTPFHTTLEIEPRDPVRLEKLCASLLRQIDLSTSYEEAAEAALALSYVKDPIAVPYLGRALTGGHMVESAAVAGLKRIADDHAVDILISAMRTQPSDTARQVRAALVAIETRTSDSNLREKIRRILPE